MFCRLAVAGGEKNESTRHCALSFLVSAMEPSNFWRKGVVDLNGVCLFFAHLVSF